MAEIVGKSFNDAAWIFETKLVGYRAIVAINSSGKSLVLGTIIDQGLYFLSFLAVPGK
jgi:hypothetical protein